MDSNRLENGTIELTNSCVGQGDTSIPSTSYLIHETPDIEKPTNRVEDSVKVTTTGNDLESYSGDYSWENEVIISRNRDSQLSVTKDEQKTIAIGNTEKKESENKVAGDVFLVCSGNTNESCRDNGNVRNIRDIDVYRKSIDCSDEIDSSDSESSSTVSENDENDDDNNSLGNKHDSVVKKIIKSIKTRGELGLEDLPPIEDLEISVDERKCREMGIIDNIVETQVVIQSFPNLPTLDLDTILFLDCGQRPLGKIFDVLGNIRGPFYAVRFNSADHIKEKNITKSQKVYFVPDSEFTLYVNTAELLRDKGSDASWHHNNEPPITCLDFSDDEDEAKAKRSVMVLGSKRNSQVDNDLFVKKMNERNLELTAKRKKEDEVKQKRVPHARKMTSNVKNPIEVTKFNSQTYRQFTDNYKIKGRAFSIGDQMTAAHVVNFHHNSGATHAQLNKFEPVSRSVNFLVGGYSSPSNFALPPQHFLCSSPRQLPNVVPNAQNYLSMYSRPPVQAPSAMPPPPPPSFSNFNSGSIATMPPTLTTQPGIHPALHGPISHQFSNYSLSAPPLPSSLAPSYFSCADASTVPQPTFIPLNIRPGMSAAAFHQFVLPPPPPPPPQQPPMQHHSHASDLTSRPDRRNTQAAHSNTSYYPHTPYNL